MNFSADLNVGGKMRGLVWEYLNFAIIKKTKKASQKNVYEKIPFNQGSSASLREGWWIEGADFSKLLHLLGVLIGCDVT